MGQIGHIMVQKGLKMLKKRQKIEFLDLKRRFFSLTELGGTPTPNQVPRPTFGSGSGLQCVYTVVISLWGTPAPKFVLEPPKTVFYWILLCIRKPQAEFQKFSSTHVSPSNRFISSPQLPLLVGTKDEEYLPIWTLYFSVHVSLHFFVDDLP